MEKLINDFSFGLFIWQIILFLLLLFLLRKFAWKPILKAVEDRETGIKDALDSAEKAKLEMANLQADNEKLLQEARAERDTMLKEAREMKTKMIADAKEEAQAEANKTIANAQVAIEGEKKAAIAELKQTVATLSVEIAEKVVKQELSDKSKQLELVDTMLKDANLN
ncbi:MAG TPA: F0F1 ATP synthase subunit B [Flavobacteriaceae bacterium]|jgi:F-type H+-transporting ATPase subunit b|nr:ATP synthase F0 subunit B [Flavobacteriaceae bacterium]MAY53305.1 ATP synthase F0 subunit B [Flavobacteriaceae bacterium]HBR53349.1 F0F1 ATP synthase subunit B [Flavobacteriaceae bacterium]HIB47496.1 F0F1 ATP synthase subunit B [Flavobacteriaceae bacterium]HIN98984.1 F0F1 ATP synthase subunit B [Flavobacteriaceae bacterium]